MNDPDTYHLAYTATPPALDDHEVKRREVRTFFDGSPFSFTVVGDSHYVGCAEAGYHELLTCNPRGGDRPDATAWERDGLEKTVPLAVGHEERLRHVLDGVGVETVIAGEPLATFDSPAAADIAYRFGPDAYTTIDLVADDTYRTYHTYPERDLALRTETTLVALPPGER